MRSRLTRIVVGLAAAVLIGFTTVAANCDDVGDTQVGIDNRQNSVEQRADNFNRARTKFPQPNQTNFPMREALVKYTQRQDLLNHPWYVYVSNECFQCPGGIAYQYYIGQTYPQSTCNFLGSTEEVQIVGRDMDDVTNTPMKFQAPSLDGIFYGSGATTGGCDYFMFDMATDALLVFHHNWLWFVSDKILLLDAKLISPR